MKQTMSHELQKECCKNMCQTASHCQLITEVHEFATDLITLHEGNSQKGTVYHFYQASSHDSNFTIMRVVTSRIDTDTLII